MKNRTLEQIVDDSMYGLDDISDELLINIKLRMQQCALSYSIQELNEQAIRNAEIIEKVFSNQ